MERNTEIRRESILNLINKLGSVTFTDLRQAFPGVSDVTLRKDLQHLDDNQMAVRTHGGAKSIPSALNYYYRSNINSNLKQIVASKAASLIRPGDSIFISAGTTCAEFARHLPSFPLKVCSNGIFTVNNISALPNISVELLGGNVDLDIMRTEGISTLDQLQNRHFNTAFLGTLSLNLDYGFAHHSALTLAIIERITQQSERTVIMLDSTKLSERFYPHFLRLNRANIIVSDGNLPPEAVKRLEDSGIQVI